MTLYGVSGMASWDGKTPLIYCGPDLLEAVRIKKQDSNARTIYALNLTDIKKVDVCVSCGQTIKENSHG